MTAPEIYEKYRIMRNLQEHQIRVAAVAKMVCDHFQGPIDAQSVITAALFHDMGNIVKFKLTYFPEFLEPEGLQYWEHMQKASVSKYGEDSHAANIAIAKEIGLSQKVQHLINCVSFSRMPETLARGTFEEKIVEYADTRVGPFGILSIRDRFADGAKRYAYRYSSPEEAAANYETHVTIAEEIERNVLANTDIRSDDITDDACAPLVEELKHFQVM